MPRVHPLADRLQGFTGSLFELLRGDALATAHAYGLCVDCEPPASSVRPTCQSVRLGTNCRALLGRLLRNSWWQVILRHLALIGCTF